MVKKLNCVTDSFIVHEKTDDIFKHIIEDVEARFASNYEINRPSPIGESKKVIGLMKNEWGGKIMKKFVRLRVKTCGYLKDSHNQYKKTKETKKCVIKKKF